MSLNLGKYRIHKTVHNIVVLHNIQKYDQGNIRMTHDSENDCLSLETIKVNPFSIFGEPFIKTQFLLFS